MRRLDPRWCNLFHGSHLWSLWARKGFKARCIGCGKVERWWRR